MQVAVNSAPVGHVSKPTSEVCITPHGRSAVLVENLWAGYLFGQSESGGNKTLVLFRVEMRGDSLIAKYDRDCTGQEKKGIQKRLHHLHDIQMYAARTTAGERCQLFTD